MSEPDENDPEVQSEKAPTFRFSNHQFATLVAAAGLEELQLDEVRYRLEMAISKWLASPGRNDVRDRVARQDRLTDAVDRLLWEMDQTGSDWLVDIEHSDRHLSEVLTEISGSWEQVRGSYIEEEPREHLAQVLCRAWVNLGRKASSSFNPVDGTAGGPLVNFLMVASEAALKTPLTTHQARYQIRKFQASEQEWQKLRDRRYGESPRTSHS